MAYANGFDLWLTWQSPKPAVSKGLWEVESKTAPSQQFTRGTGVANLGLLWRGTTNGDMEMSRKAHPMVTPSLLQA
eukprot:1161269-Pelagomonas_calceolata.AAC.6